MAYRPARPGSEGNTRLLKQYGGGSSPPRQHYATGGKVKGGDNPSLSEGLSAAGSPAKASLARPGRKMPDKGGKKGTNVNVIVMPKGGDDKAAAPPMDMPPPPMAGPPPMPMPPPGAGPGGPPMPMRAKGGRVVKHDDAKADKKMVADAVHKHEKHDHKGKPMTKLSVGGPAKAPTTKGMVGKKGYQGGAGGGVGRLEKMKAYGK